MEVWVYVALIGVVALVAGITIGAVWKRAVIRRQVAPLQDEVTRLKATLQARSQDEVPQRAATPQRWTATEIAAIFGALGTLIGASAAALNSYQGRAVTELQQKLQVAESKSAAKDLEMKNLEGELRSLFGFSVSEWKQLVDRTPSVPRTKTADAYEVRDRRVSAPCADQRLRLSYDGGGPAVVRCKDRVTLHLSRPTRVMLAPDPL